jgi:hypothetical protein
MCLLNRLGQVALRVGQAEWLLESGLGSRDCEQTVRKLTSTGCGLRVSGQRIRGDISRMTKGVSPAEPPLLNRGCLGSIVRQICSYIARPVV